MKSLSHVRSNAGGDGSKAKVYIAFADFMHVPFTTTRSTTITKIPAINRLYAAKRLQIQTER